MTEHLYACGQHVSFTDRRFTGPAWTGSFVIAELLPSGGGAPRYRIKSTGETYSRAVFEHQLTADVGMLDGIRSRGAF
ncbi:MULTISPECIES: hypothetical protein [Microvirga]|uniref:hypothetical protein n=1 Tax=Microvirga TaxID=186650 RepID=UPI001CFFA4F2|nr:hypothetical protein [Microvirga lenta]MCB5176232.1 hypothetical protein [Microvirga lenta]